MNDIEAINDAYTNAVKNLFNVLLTSFMLANGDTGKEQVAEEAFKKGLEFIRKIRERAIAISGK